MFLTGCINTGTKDDCCAETERVVWDSVFILKKTINKLVANETRPEMTP